MFSNTTISTDSLRSKINRNNSDTLPEEYYDGIYTNQTDMFYLAELFNRLMKQCENSDLLDFSYQDILEKMMKKSRCDRYNSFMEIKDAINKHDLVNMNVTSADKETYQYFANSLYNCLQSFSGERKFNSDISIFISTIDRCLANNMFEYEIQNPSDLLKSIIISGFSYLPNYRIETADVKKFIDWFKNSTEQSQKLIINNLITKLSKIPIVYNDFGDVPF